MGYSGKSAPAGNADKNRSPPTDRRCRRAEMAGNQLIVKLSQRLQPAVRQHAALPQQSLRLLLDKVQPGKPAARDRLVSSFHAIRCSRVCSSARLLSPVSSIMRVNTGMAGYAPSGNRSPPRRGPRRDHSAEMSLAFTEPFPASRRQLLHNHAATEARHGRKAGAALSAHLSTPACPPPR